MTPATSSRWASVAAGLALCVVAALGATGSGIIQGSVPVEPVIIGATPPADTTQAWLNTGDHLFYRWNPDLDGGAWQDVAGWTFTGSHVTGAENDLRFGQGMESDTTRAAPNGWYAPDSLWIERMDWSCVTYPPTSINMTIDLVESVKDAAPVIIATKTWTSNAAGDTVRAVCGPGKLALVMTSTSAGLETWVRVRAHKFVRGL